MKILCIADVKDPLIYSNSIKERFRDVDVVLGAGDLPLDYYSFVVSSLNKPLLFIFGNHELKDIVHYKQEFQSVYSSRLSACDDYEHCGAIFAGGRVIRVGGLIVAGLGGSMRYNDGLNQYTNFGMWLSVLRLVPRLLWNRLVRGRYLDIMLTHAPPRGIHDDTDPCHRGFNAFLWLIEKFKPKLFIHGHTHLYTNPDARETIHHATRIINAYSHTVVELDHT